MIVDEIKGQIKERGRYVGFTAWLTTSSLSIAVILLVFLGIGQGKGLDLVFFLLMFLVQGIMTATWLPEGKKYGERNALFMEIQKAYNAKIDRIIEEELITNLGEYCNYDFGVRYRNYFTKMLGRVGLSYDVFEKVKNLSVKNFIVGEMVVGGDKFTFNKIQIKTLKTLIFKPCPIQANSVETIMGGSENSEIYGIRDWSKFYEKRYLGVRGGFMIITAIITAFLGLKITEGVTMMMWIQAVLLLGGIVLSLTSAFLTGEKSKTVYKREFYIDATNFLDGFYEWNKIKGGNENGRFNDKTDNMGA
jgi:hypothetical protein